METPSIQQKLVTIYLDDATYAKGRVVVGSFGDHHGFIEEHLDAYLTDGWRVAAMMALAATRTP